MPKREFLGVTFTSLFSLFWFAGVVLLIHLFCLFVVRLDDAYPEVDTLFHFMGGVSIAHGWERLLQVWQRRQLLGKMDPLIRAFLLLGLVALAAVLWDSLEFLGDYIWGTKMQAGLTDTMVDLALGLLGGMVYCWLAGFFSRQDG